jgi:hypothetical protein
MQLNVTIDLGDLWDEEMSAGDLITEELRNSVVRQAAKTIAGPTLKKLAEDMSRMVSKQISDLMRERVESFMSEEIALTGRWGEPNFVGTIEDLMKKHFDETIFGPVDSTGKRLQGCTSSSMTFAEWFIKKGVSDAKKRDLEQAKDVVTSAVKKEIKAELERHKEESIKNEVGTALHAILGTK